MTDYLDKIEALEKRATPGPWHQEKQDGPFLGPDNSPIENSDHPDANIDFALEARTFIPWAIKMLREADHFVNQEVVCDDGPVGGEYRSDRLLTFAKDLQAGPPVID